MKKKNFNLMNQVDDDLIDRANPENIKPIQKKLTKKKIGVLAACLAIAVIAVNLAIFLPMGNGNDNIIGGDIQNGVQTAGDYDYIKSILDSNKSSEQLNGSLGFDSNTSIAPGGAAGGTGPVGGAAGGSAPGMNDSMEDLGGSTGSSGSFEVTDNQVDGVLEADLFKRTQTHIFYLRRNTIYAYSIDKENSSLVGELQFSDGNATHKEMFLSSDGKTAIVIFSKYLSNSTETKVVSIDVSTPESMKIIKANSFKGSYKSSRYVNGEILLFTNFFVQNTNSLENYIPSADTGNGYQLLSPDNIVAPSKINSSTYLVVSKLNGSNLSFGGSIALLDYTGTLYVSNQSVYASRTIYESKTVNNIYYYANKSDIVRLNYGSDLLSIVGSIAVNGTIKDQYCMDEKDGILRVFTTTSDGYYTVYYGGSSSSSSSGSVSGGASTGSGSASGSAGTIEPSAPSTSPTQPSVSRSSQSNRSASLFCIDINTMTVKTAVENFAPQGESVQSARFDGNTAYVCTAIVFTDPVFVFDLSDLNNITFVDTGVIDGYSHSLIELEGGLLLGIGQTDRSTIKLELYIETDDALSSISKIELLYSYGTEEYKAHYINREEMVFGFAYSTTSYSQYNYQTYYFYDVYKIVDGEIVLASRTNLSPCQAAYCRGVLVDNYFYILTDASNGFYAVNVD